MFAGNGWVKHIREELTGAIGIHPVLRTKIQTTLAYIEKSDPVPFFHLDGPGKCGPLEVYEYPPHERPFDFSLLIEDVLSTNTNETDIMVVDSLSGDTEPSWDDDGCGLSRLLGSYITTYTHTEQSRLLSAFDVPWSKRGMWTMRPKFHAPAGFSGIIRKGKVAYQSAPDDYYSTTFTQPGQLTYPHVDYYGGSQIVVHLSGKKLWLIWYPTGENLAELWKSHLEDNVRVEYEQDLVAWICRLKGAIALYVDKPVMFRLPAFAIHAVISFTTSAHSGCYAYFEREFQVTELVAQCVMHVAKLPARTREDNKFVQRWIDMMVNGDLEMWKKVAEKSKDRETFAKIYSWRDNMKKEMNELQRRIDTCGGAE
ncbi:hypothetical protein MPER_13247 [Moniliophthora perniciosa FA553]|nr:hypothetical protein MPER_13247 [Moniliophthora perniciosa FA553]